MLARWVLNDLFLVGSSRSVALASGIRGLGTPAPLAATPWFLRRKAFLLATDRRFRLALGARALKRPQEIRTCGA